MRRRIAFALVVAGLCAGTATASEPTALSRTGDILRAVLPAAALGWSLAEDDVAGRHDFQAAFLVTVTTTLLLKRVVDKPRPNGGRHAFPSGHTAMAVVGADFLYARYGPEKGLPALALAGLVAYSRVRGQHHDAADVFGGAVLALASNRAFVRERFAPPPLPAAVSVGPMIGRDGVGIVWTLRW